MSEDALNTIGLSASSRDSDDDEGLFGRDENGQLIRRDEPAKEDYQERITVHIDGKPVTVRKAARKKDAQGNIIYELDGKTTVPRLTTIYDAMVRQLKDSGQSNDKNPIPVICHQQHMTPVAVCRMCSVMVGKEGKVDGPKLADGSPGEKKAGLKMERRLTAACQRPVEKGMHVFTTAAQPIEGYVGSEDQVKRAAKDVRSAVEIVYNLLATGRLKTAPDYAKEFNQFNELKKLDTQFKLTEKPHFGLLDQFTKIPDVQPKAESAGRADHRPLDRSSPVFHVDHSACILCDRCVRACDDVKKNNIISRTGKGATAGISFDLDDPMGDSNCVQCGECMVSCPTTAIMFTKGAPINLHQGDKKESPKPNALLSLFSPAKPKPKPPSGGTAVVARVKDLMNDPQFSELPIKFLLWQQGLVLRRDLKAGDYLCRKGDPGNSAFLIRGGKLGVVLRNNDGTEKILERTVDDIIVGEMACMTGMLRSADVKALTDSVVLEVRRNVLDRIMQSPDQREKFEKIYSDHALSVVLRDTDLFRDLKPVEDYEKCVSFLSSRLSFVRLQPGQTIFNQGEFGDAMYFVRLGHMRIAMSGKGRQTALLSRGPGAVIGEISLLAISTDETARSEEEAKVIVNQLDKKIGEALAVPVAQLSAALPSGKRTATCSALDHLEMARISRLDFLEMVQRFPSVRLRLVEMAITRLLKENQNMSAAATLGDFVTQGLYEGLSLLVLDLDKCTRCDECVRACVDEHGTESHGMPISRLKRDGLRFENYLVATSCRSCKDAYCMIGCPVDSIHRGKHGQIVIEDHCIGCGLCEKNCPYGNINLLPDHNHKLEYDDPKNPGRTLSVARPKASVCDLCDAEGVMDKPEPRCVHACPHDAAHRMSGEDLRTEFLAKLV